MDRQKKRVCTICARGGSKGVVNKNLRPLLGIPLIVHTIRQARAADIFECLAVSSDSEAILDVARAEGIEYLIVRPPVLATDTSAKVPAIGHALVEVSRNVGHDFDTLVDLDATSPLRTPQDIIACVGLLEMRSVSSVITGAPSHRSPYFNLVERSQNGQLRVVKELPGGELVRRQDAPDCFDLNASIYAWDAKVFTLNPQIFYPDTLLYEMPVERSWDIDHPIDFEIVEFLMERNQKHASGKRDLAELKS